MSLVTTPLPTPSNDASSAMPLSPSQLTSSYRVLFPEKYNLAFQTQGLRPDGRDFKTLRPTSIVPSVLNQADARGCVGSALVKRGRTSVLASASFHKGVLPFPTASVIPVIATGEFVIQLKMAAAASKKQSSGTQQQRSSLEAALSCRLEALLTPLVSLTALVCDVKDDTPQEAYKLILDVLVFGDDGNVLDAAYLACLSTLTRVQIPTLAPSIVAEKEDDSPTSRSMTLDQSRIKTSMRQEEGQHVLSRTLNFPILCSFGLFPATSSASLLPEVVLDLSRDEMDCAMGALCVSISPDGQMACLEQRRGNSQLSEAQVSQALALARTSAVMMNTLLLRQ